MKSIIPSGVWPILISPFHFDGSTDLSVLDSLLDFYIKNQVAGVFVLGQASEFLTLTSEERFATASRVAQLTDGKLAWTCAGNYGKDLKEQAESLNKFAALGPNAVVVSISILPSAEKMDDQLLKLADLVNPDVHLGIYECPDPEHRLLNAEQVGRIAASGRFYIMKDTCRQIEPFRAKVAAAAGTSLKIFQANWKILPESMDAGAAGFCGQIPIIAPELANQTLDVTRNSLAVRMLAYKKTLDFQDWMRAEGFPVAAKYILQKRGLPVTYRCRVSSPESFTDENRARIDAHLAEQDWFARIGA